jgi:uncharacterized protein (TIGR01244 family)
MVRCVIPFVVMALTFFGRAAIAAEKPAEAALDRVVKVEAIKDLFQTGDFYIGGQPNLETLRWLRSQGMTLVINLRTENENKEFAAASFNEENMVKELGIAYCPIPVGEKDSYSPKTLDRFAQAIKANSGKALVHCASGGRATQLWMAYLVRYRAYALNDAVVIGKQMKFTLPVEDFLGARVSLTVEDTKK